MNALHALAALAATLVAGAPRAQADIHFPDFTSLAGLNLVGASSQSGSALRLTPLQTNVSGAAWFGTRQLVADDFYCDFSFAITPAGGADGLAFVIQNTLPALVGPNGCRLGYHGIPNSVAIEIDTFSDASCQAGVIGDPPAIHVSVHTLGTNANSVSETASIGATTGVPDLADSGTHRVRLRYTASEAALRVFVDDLGTPVLRVAIDLSATLSLTSGQAYVGFSAATGASAAVHDLLSWRFGESAAPTGNNAPLAPALTEPATDGQLVSPSDVHMETALFDDPDVGDAHLCSDYEIWRANPSELVWRTSCISGPELLHTHLGDGVFQGSLAGDRALEQNTNWRLRARHRDDSGDASTEWSPWRERLFRTGSASDVFALEVEDVSAAPTPSWAFALGGLPVILPAGAGTPRLQLEASGVGLLLELAANDGLSNALTNPPGLANHGDLLVRVEAGPAPLALAASDLSFVDDDCERHTLYLPALNLPAQGVALFWVATTGSTWVATPGQTSADFTTLARVPEPPWTMSEPGYVVEVFATGLELPVHLAFVPDPGPNADDPFLYVTELYGRIQLVTRDGSVSPYATNLLNYNPTGVFPGSGEQGVTGIAVDPVSGDVFASMLYDSASTPGTHYPKVVRFTSLDGGHTAASQTTILDLAGEAQGQSHQISALTIHPDGSLLVHVGDGFIATTALDLGSYRGKLLRVDLDGNPRVDNPFYDASNGISALDFIWAYGLRNPFGGAFRAADGNQYEVENGPSSDRFAKIVAGRNMGWDGTETSMATHALYQWIPAHAPVSLAFVQPASFGGSGFPAEKQGHAFVTESGPTFAQGGQALGKRISEFVLAADGSLQSGPTPFLEYAGQGRATACGLAAGPDGLYMSDLYLDAGALPSAPGARILRVRYLGGVDCNANGTPDYCDIASGTSLDTNGDGLPDECDCLGLTFCTSEINSTGFVTGLASNGQCTVSDNAFALSAAPVPNQTGIFFYGSGQAAGGAGLPFFNGRLCVSGALQRLTPVTATGQVATTTLDFSSPPTAAGQIGAGSSWNFQFWYRDPAGGGSFANLSNGITVHFQ